MTISLIARVRNVLVTGPTASAAFVRRFAQETLPPGLSRVLPSGQDLYEIAPHLGRLIANLVLQDGRRRVLEFGAGASSEVLATALAATGGGMLTSIEADPVWCRDRWSAVEATGADAVLVPATLRFAISSFGAYFAQPAAMAAVRERGPFDLVIIDAPDGRHGRTGTLHQVAPWLARGALVVVDDTARPFIQGMLTGWLRIYRGLTLLGQDVSFGGRGVAVLRWDGGPAAFSVRSWLTSAYEALSLERRRRERRRRRAGR
jgi:predicted O-methyltransferase YrrM